MKKLFLLVLSLSFLASCQTYQTVRVTPESLISASSEKVSFSILDDSSLDSIKQWAEGDVPTNARIECANTNSDICLETQALMDYLEVPSDIARSASGSDSIDLIYERVTSRDCSNRGFGCSVSVNSVQMVTNNSQFTNPPLSDPQDAGKAVERFNHYMIK